jgi:hypothetical protein
MAAYPAYRPTGFTDCNVLDDFGEEFGRVIQSDQVDFDEDAVVFLPHDNP